MRGAIINKDIKINHLEELNLKDLKEVVGNMWGKSIQ